MAKRSKKKKRITEIAIAKHGDRQSSWHRKMNIHRDAMWPTRYSICNRHQQQQQQHRSNDGYSKRRVLYCCDLIGGLQRSLWIPCKSAFDLSSLSHRRHSQPASSTYVSTHTQTIRNRIYSYIACSNIRRRWSVVCLSMSFLCSCSNACFVRGFSSQSIWFLSRVVSVFVFVSQIEAKRHTSCCGAE